MTKFLYIFTSLLMSVFFNKIAFAEKVQVVKIVDGDTFDVFFQDKIIRIRPVCADAPESYQTFQGIKIGKMATKELSKLLPLNSIIDIIPHYKDHYKNGNYRVVASVYIGGVNISHYLIQNGYAYAHKTFCSKQEINMQIEAQKAKKGLWQYGDFTNPIFIKHPTK